ncbi:hypothetical protein FA13DRAFT_1793991 [Coprinellus micaceus]|uniref:Uncharacterized protein n=1 Tax=Coprinellus micaceus TaxID=71717 RepID=A0A4Y7T3I1_COPMI|nr:hypothetical protein FA13DRAFT_1793991 [Coprinellus micaceus]
MPTREQKEAKLAEFNTLVGADGPVYRTQGDLEQVQCPKCEGWISLGPGGLGNVVHRHVDSKTCLATQKKIGKIPPSSKPERKTMLSFFSHKPKPVKVVTTTTESPLISTQPNLEALASSELLPLHDESSPTTGLNVIFTDPTTPPPSLGTTEKVVYGPETDPAFNDHPKAWQELAHMSAKLVCPTKGTENDYLADFEGPTNVHDNPNIMDEDVMEEVVNPLCHRVFGYGDAIRQEQYFVEECGVRASMFQDRMERLFNSLKKWGATKGLDEEILPQPVTLRPALCFTLPHMSCRMPVDVQ